MFILNKLSKVKAGGESKKTKQEDKIKNQLEKEQERKYQKT
jgi:hypothetical protein